MTARITGFDTRAEVGLLPPRSVSYNVDASKGGVAVHYGGGGSLGVSLAAGHERCRAVMRSFQRSHMAKGWNDFAYSGAFCVCGYALAGRGFGVRTAANGTEDANNRYLAYVFLGNEGDLVTPQAYDALDWWIHEARTAGKAGLNVDPHSALFNTACPGAPLRQFAVLRDMRPVPLPGVITPQPTPKPPAPVNPPLTPKRTPRAVGVLRRGSTGPLVSILQRMLGVAADGVFGANTQRAVLTFQASTTALADDGAAGPMTQRALLARFGVLNQGDNNPGVRLVQWIGNVAQDGDFGPNTRTAVVQMQAWAGLATDGAVGPNTRAKIVR